MPDSPAKLTKAQTFVRRTSSTVFLWAVVTGVFVSGWTWAFIGLLTILMLIATHEFFQMLKKGGVPCFPIFGLICAAGFYVFQFRPLLDDNFPGPYATMLAIPVVAIGAFTLQLRHKIEGINALVAVATNVLGFVYIPLMFSFAAKLLFLPLAGYAVNNHPSLNHLPPDSAFLLLWLIAVTKFTDMGAYITGSLIGKHKMIPHISPAKTWEGFAGGLFFAQLAGFGLYLCFWEHLEILAHPKHVAILGLILAVLAVIGDLAESIVKRSVDAKDSGNMLPGIGGSLDLIDSICFTAPAMYLYIAYVIYY